MVHSIRTQRLDFLIFQKVGISAQKYTSCISIKLLHCLLATESSLCVIKLAVLAELSSVYL